MKLGVARRATTTLPIVYSNIKDQPINQATLKIKVTIICIEYENKRKHEISTIIFESIYFLNKILSIPIGPLFNTCDSKKIAKILAFIGKVGNTISLWKSEPFFLNCFF